MANHLNPQHLIYAAMYEFSSLVSSMCFWLYWSLAFFPYFNVELNLLVATSYQFGSLQKKNGRTLFHAKNSFFISSLRPK